MTGDKVQVAIVMRKVGDMEYLSRWIEEQHRVLVGVARSP